MGQIKNTQFHLVTEFKEYRTIKKWVKERKILELFQLETPQKEQKYSNKDVHNVTLLRLVANIKLALIFMVRLVEKLVKCLTSVIQMLIRRKESLGDVILCGYILRTQQNIFLELKWSLPELKRRMNAQI